MAIKAFVTDLDGTLLLSNGSPVPGYDEILTQLKAYGLRIVVFSNKPRGEVLSKLKALSTDIDLVLTKEDVGKSKGSPVWIDTVCNYFKFKNNDLIYLGDSLYDMLTAVSSKVVYLNAEWSQPGYKYGIPITSPGALHLILKHFFLKTDLWYWSIDTKDAQGKDVVKRALIHGRDIGFPAFKNALINWVKNGTDSKVGMLTIGEFMFYHLLGSIYLEGIFTDVDTVALAPVHAGGINPSIEDSLIRIARLFRDNFIQTLLKRHTEAKKSAFSRVAGQSPGFQNQITTVHVECEPEKRAKIIEGKTILVVDDFITEGFTTEWTKHLLLNAGANKVISVSFGAFHDSIFVQSISDKIKWDSFSPVKINEKFLSYTDEPADLNSKAIDTMTSSYIELHHNTH